MHRPGVQVGIQRTKCAPEWSGLIHEKHRDFGFAAIVLDLGGGGDFIEPELRKTRQRIEGHAMDVTPIVRPGDTRVIAAHQILYLLLRTDEGVRELWPELANARGSDVLKYFANGALRTGLEKQVSDRCRRIQRAKALQMDETPGNHATGRDSDTDAAEVFSLLTDGKELLGKVYHEATEPPGKVMAKADLANFLLLHAVHIREIAKAAVILMHAEEPYAVVPLARSALESTFTLAAAAKDSMFGPQRMAFELEDLARKLRLLLEKRAWVSSRRPSPDDCLHEAERIRTEYGAAGQ